MKFIIFKRPRNVNVVSFFVFLFFFVFSIYVEFISTSNLLHLNEINRFVSINSLTVKSLSFIFPIFLFFAMLIAAVRNNTKYQPIETSLFFVGLFLFIFFFFFSTPLLFFWAHIHHYHLDHFEPAHRGGWYIFKLDGSP